MIKSQLSIIIPIYNIEDYLPTCINSILNQEFDDYELLLINDGSTDNSGKICDQYALKDNKIRVYHQTNAGVSAARNLGIEKAKGKWICFVDGDDSIEQNSLSKMISKLNTNELDLLIARSFVDDYNKTEKITERYSFSNDLLNKSYSGIYLATKKHYNRGAVWGVMYSRNFLLANKIHFPVGIRNSEDMIFFALCLIYANSINFVDIRFYNINQREGSASRNWTQEKVPHLLESIDFINNYKLLNSNLSKEALNILDYGIYRVVSSMYNHLYECFSMNLFLTLTKDVKSRMQNKLDTGNISTNKAKIKFLNFSVLLFGVSVLFNCKIRSLRS